MRLTTGRLLVLTGLLTLFSFFASYNLVGWYFTRQASRPDPSAVPLASILGVITTFAAYIAETGLRINSETPFKITVFAPVNDAIHDMDILPHEGPGAVAADMNYTNPWYSIYRKNFAGAWVLGHVVPVRPLQIATGRYKTALVNATLDVEVQEGEGPVWQRTTVNGVKLLRKAQVGNVDVYVISDSLFHWDPTDIGDSDRLFPLVPRPH